jgi:phosphohistidine swiveling domain-containing protein
MDYEIYDVNNILLPVEHKIGALNRAKNLVAEMTHPNIDWKYMVTELRAYLYDYMYDIVPHSDKVLPVIFHYLKEATVRKRGSTLRAADTFLDRYLFLIKKEIEGDSSLENVTAMFDSEAIDFCQILIADTLDGFYLEDVNLRILQLLELSLKRKKINEKLFELCIEIITNQFKLYVERSIIVEDEDVYTLQNLWSIEHEHIRQLEQLVKSVTQKAYQEKLKKAKALKNSKKDRASLLTEIKELIDFHHNTSFWEKICIAAKDCITQNIIEYDDVVLVLLTFLVKKSQEGRDANLQLYISRSVASLCGVLVQQQRFVLLRQVVQMVVPVLVAEIERGGNYNAAFATILNIGKTVVQSDNRQIINLFVDILVHAKFCFPQFTGIAQDWSVMVNASHLANIRTWLELIELNPVYMKRLAASLIANLTLGGVFLKDTDVFQRDISRLLNSNYRDVFYLIISLAAVFPAFYHDIGATGNIRAFTERVDTNHQMNDLIHFVRKQVHVESSSRTVVLLQRVMDFWLTGDKELLKGMVPQEVYNNLERTFRLINLDNESVARRIYTEIRHYFPELVHEKFWDFFYKVGKKHFMDVIAQHTFEGMDEDEKKDAIECIVEYFDKQFPAEMTKMLHHIAGMFDIDTSRRQIWRFLYEIPDDDFRKMFENVQKLDVSNVNIEKFITFLHVYRMIFDKYNFSDIRAIEKLHQYAQENLFSPPENFFKRLEGNDNFDALEAILELQHTLKSDILLSPQVFEPVDTIEFKRHIAFGIPSMYGSYKEKKFDTLKVFFHCNIVRLLLFEKILENINIYPHQKVDYDAIKRVIKLFIQSFEIDGLANHEMRAVTSLLDAPNLTLTQFRDVIYSLLVIHGEISDRFNDTFKSVSRIAIKNIGIENIIHDFIPPDQPASVEVIVDRFLRNRVMQSPLLQLLDNLLLKLKDNLIHELSYLGNVIILNKVDARIRKGRLVHIIGKYSGAHDETALYAPLWEVGAKAQGLIIAANIDGINVPEGLVISSELYKRIKDSNINNPRFKRKLIYMLKKYIDEFTGYRFGNPENPILVSVRSGAVFSMPGVMDTITNVGMTEDIVPYFAQYDEWFAWDCYRRVIHDFAISAFGMDRHIFENLMAQAKDEAGVDLKEKLNGKQMSLLTRKYRFAINKVGYSVPKDPYEQLFYAIIAVYQSWDSAIAQNYRRFINLSDDWGTAVIVQRMVFGNLSPTSITGVVHSQYIEYEDVQISGEYKTRAQGHDIVSGVAKVFPISEQQKLKFARFALYPSMEKAYPAHYAILRDAVTRLRKRWDNDIEVEFTFENEKLYILQIRGMAKHMFDIEELVETPQQLQEYLLGQGLAASGGAVSGRAVFDINRIEMMRMHYPKDKIILIRPETNPEDVIGLQKSDGILTSVGGMTSHAVLQMRRLEKSGVSDFSIMKIVEDEHIAIINREQGGKIIIREGDFITIDGNTGHVYLGYHATRRAHR